MFRDFGWFTNVLAYIVKSVAHVLPVFVIACLVV